MRCLAPSLCATMTTVFCAGNPAGDLLEEELETGIDAFDIEIDEVDQSIK